MNQISSRAGSRNYRFRFAARRFSARIVTADHVADAPFEDWVAAEAAGQRALWSAGRSEIDMGITARRIFLSDPPYVTAQVRKPAC